LLKAQQLRLAKQLVEDKNELQNLNCEKSALVKNSDHAKSLVNFNFSFEHMNWQR